MSNDCSGRQVYDIQEVTRKFVDVQQKSIATIAEGNPELHVRLLKQLLHSLCNEATLIAQAEGAPPETPVKIMLDTVRVVYKICPDDAPLVVLQ